MNYLKSLFSEVYLRDIVERKKIRHEDILSATLDLLCSAIGSLTNPNNIANSPNSRQKLSGEKKTYIQSAYALENDTISENAGTMTMAYWILASSIFFWTIHSFEYLIKESK